MKNKIDCMYCGMVLSRDMAQCPKCDDLLETQTDGHIATVDIAHDRETIREATNKLNKTLDEVNHTRGAGARFIVGTGRIREAIGAELATYLYRKSILSFEFEGKNEGAILVMLRKPPVD
jgi:hypothetical protein